MADDCIPLITDTAQFPRRPVNRPALDQINYRIGEYPDMLTEMIRQIDRDVALSRWTHRAADDPAIALIEGAAILGDILSFYQERYANEAFMRTADWRESIADLVRVMGYRLAPALGGRATVAFEVKGDRSILVPSGFPLKADLETAGKPAEFQTDTDLTAWPHLSRFNLYRRRRYRSSLISGKESAEIATVGGAFSMSSVLDVDLKPGDRLMLLSAPPVWESSGSVLAANQKQPQILKIKEVRTVLGRSILTFETPFSTHWSAPVTAYRLGRVFRHFGHGVPAIFTENITDNADKIEGTKEKSTKYSRHVDPSHSCQATSADRPLPPKEIPLDQEVNDLAVGGLVIVEADIAEDGGNPRHLTVLRSIRKRWATAMAFAAQTGPVTFLKLNLELVTHTGLSSPAADIRDYRIHEVTSPQIELRAEARGRGGRIRSGAEALWFYGTQKEVREIAGRRMTLLDEEDGRAETLTCINSAENFSTTGSEAQMWPLSFDTPPKLFRRREFDEENPTITVLGNLVEVNQGKALPMEVLGNGDTRAVFQTFKLPKPLTYHLSASATPPQVPELAVYVENRAWTLVPSLFGQAPDAEIYIVREDADGNSWVQFGDGKTGARLPSGIANISAQIRTGHGARGPLKADTTPTAGERIPEVTKLQMPEGAAGGADREGGENAREAAPGKVQGLDRLVSLSDYETELLTLPGVLRVRAEWDTVDNVPMVVLRVLLEHGREAEYETVRSSIRSFQKCRGPNRFALKVEQAFFRQVFVDLRYGLNARYTEADVAAMLVQSLAPMDTENASRKGLFALRARQLGGREYANRIEGVAQQVEGVTWAKVTALGMFSATASRASAALILPHAPRVLNAQLTPQRNELLALTNGALTLQAAPPDVEGECA